MRCSRCELIKNHRPFRVHSRRNHTCTHTSGSIRYGTTNAHREECTCNPEAWRNVCSIIGLQQQELTRGINETSVKTFENRNEWIGGRVTCTFPMCLLKGLEEESTNNAGNYRFIHTHSSDKCGTRNRKYQLLVSCKHLQRRFR